MSHRGRNQRKLNYKKVRTDFSVKELKSEKVTHCQERC